MKTNIEKYEDGIEKTELLDNFIEYTSDKYCIPTEEIYRLALHLVIIQKQIGA